MLPALLGLLCATLGSTPAFLPPRLTEVSCLFSGAPAVADFNNDGYADVALVNLFLPIVDGSFVTYLGDGMGGFKKGPRVAVLGDTASLTFATCLGVGDIDGDGNADVVCGDGLGRLWIFPGKGDGNFALPINAAGGFVKQTMLDSCHWNYLKVFDYDGDGRSEVLAQSSIFGFCTGFNHNPLILYRHGGGFQLQPLYSSSCGKVRAVCRVDLDHNGFDDFVVSADQASTFDPIPADVYFWYVDQYGSRVYGPKFLGVSPISMTAADLDHDGYPEIVLGPEDGPCQLLTIYSPYNFTVSPLLGNPLVGEHYNFVSFVELDDDDQLELVVVKNDQQSQVHVRVYDQTTPGVFVERQYLQGMGISTSRGGRFMENAAFGDFNHDGNLDLVTTVTSNSKMCFATYMNTLTFRHGYQYLTAPCDNPRIRLAPVHGKIELGNLKFGLRLIGATGGFVIWDFIRWHDPVMFTPGFGLSVPPRIAIPIGQEIKLPIPYNPRLEITSHYFQWIGPKLETSPTIKLTFPKVLTKGL